ncbi:MAG: 8-amino-7-oxononanoate synthase, partial [Myxococcota bacterium]
MTQKPVAARRWRHALRDLEARKLRRRLRTVAGAGGRLVELDGQPVLNFSSNSYLGLADHPAMAEAARAAIARAGVGTGASRLIVGNHREHELLESELAAFHDRSAALLFNSGYNANVGTLQALADADDVIFSDALNHASIIDGCRLSRARVVVYPHNDTAALAERMKSEHGSARRMLVVTDSVFSMDGDRAPLAELSRLCSEFDAVLMADEAHASGALGPGGRGALAEAGVRAEVQIGTLGKGFGSFGAYVTGSSDLIEYLLNRARSFIFTTSLPVGVVAATRAALRLIQGEEGQARRACLHEHIEHFRAGLESLGLLVPDSGTTAIFPVMVRDDQAVMECSERLLSKGIYAQGIRPPTVPIGTARLRFTVMA